MIQPASILSRMKSSLLLLAIFLHFGGGVAISLTESAPLKENEIGICSNLGSHNDDPLVEVNWFGAAGVVTSALPGDGAAAIGSVFSLLAQFGVSSLFSGY